MEFILSPFPNYDFIFISLVFSRGGVKRRGKGRKEAGKYRFKEGFFVVLSELLAVSKVQGLNGSCRDPNLIPMSRSSAET